MHYRTTNKHVSLRTKNWPMVRIPSFRHTAVSSRHSQRATRGRLHLDS